MKTPKLKQQALGIWADNLKKGRALRTVEDIPDPAVREILKRENLVFTIRRGFFILKKPEDDPEQLFLLLYWQIIEKLFERYKPWSIRADSALELLMGNEQNQKHLLARTGKKINKTLILPFDFKATLLFDRNFDPRITKEIKIADRLLSVDIPEKVLIDSVSQRKHISPHYRGFIRGTKFDSRLIEALYAGRPTPVVMKRVIQIAENNGRQDLADDLKEIVRKYTPYHVSVKKDSKTAAIGEPEPQTIIPPWIAKQEELVKAFEDKLEESFAGDIRRISRHTLPELIGHSQEHKRYDVYHSTTLEGYRITPEEVDAVVLGKVPAEIKDREKNIEEIRNRMAILGYSQAFEFIMDKVGEDFGETHISQELIKDIYYQLFKPSADSGIIEYLDLVSYRNVPAFILGTSYVPPAASKLVDLMEGFERGINKVKSPVIKAILAHYFLVTIHPYIDGNGRTARLLMNYVLLTNGYRWETIKAEQRNPYFNALAEAQLHEDILPFGSFIISQ
jgi:Fic family protein